MRHQRCASKCAWLGWPPLRHRFPHMCRLRKLLRAPVACPVVQCSPTWCPFARWPVGAGPVARTCVEMLIQRHRSGGRGVRSALGGCPSVSTPERPVPVSHHKSWASADLRCWAGRFQPQLCCSMEHEAQHPLVALTNLPLPRPSPPWCCRAGYLALRWWRQLLIAYHNKSASSC